MNKNVSMDMCSGPLFKKIIIYSLPIMATGVLQLLFNAADLIVVGGFCGSASIAAVGSTNSLINLIVNLFMGLSLGAGVAVAQGVGSHDDKEVSRTVHTAIPLSVICGLIIMVIGLVWSRGMLELMSTPEDILDLSALYVRIYFCGVPVLLLYNFGASILRAVGDTRGPLIFLAIGGVVNVILNVIFVAVFKMNVDGVAYATVISEAISAVLVIISLMRRTDACRFCIAKTRIHAKQLKKILLIGIPTGVQSSMFSISNVIIQSSINSFGSVAAAGSGAAASIEGFVWIIMNAVTNTALNFVGQNYGAKNFARIKRVYVYCLISVAVVGIVSGALCCVFSRQLLGIYIHDSDLAISYGIERLMFVCLPYFFCGIMDVTTAIIRGMGSSFVPMVISVLGVCVMRVVWIFTVFRLPEYHSFSGLLVSYPISWALTFVVELVAFFIVFKQRTKVGAAA